MSRIDLTFPELMLFLLMATFQSIYDSSRNHFLLTSLQPPNFKKQVSLTLCGKRELQLGDAGGGATITFSNLQSTFRAVNSKLGFPVSSSYEPCLNVVSDSFGLSTSQFSLVPTIYAWYSPKHRGRLWFSPVSSPVRMGGKAMQRSLFKYWHISPELEN